MITPPRPHLSATLLAAVLCLPALPAQTAPNPPTANSPDNSSLAPAGAAAPIPSAATDQAVRLTPFEVQTDSDKSYGALNSNSITRFNVELDRAPVSADIFTQAFMNDIATNSVESMVTAYSAGAGTSAIDPGTGASAQYGDHVSHGYIQLRGFDTPVLERDSLMPVGPVFNPGSTSPGQTSNFDIERVEVIDGPQSLLYSAGGPGGVINVVSKQAHFDQALTGSFKFQLDQYGSKLGEVDVGTGNDTVAVRVAILNQDQDSRRVDIGQTIEGYYAQVAFRLWKKTVVRINAEQTTEKGVNGGSFTLTSSSATADSRQSDYLSYLLATNQTGANTFNAAGAPNASGAILGGQLNWGNVNSLAGWLANEYTINTFENLTADTQWNSWLSTEIAVGYNKSIYDFANATNATFYAPQSTANPTGTWAIGVSPGDDYEPARTKGLRFSTLATNELFGGRARSQTILGGDFVRSDADSIQYNYFEADANFNVLINPSVSTFAGRTELAKQYYPIANGPVPYPFMSPEAKYLSIGGVNYVRQPANLPESNLINAANPLGLTNTSLYEVTKNFNKGFFAANFTEWMDGKLNTLVGVREAESFDNYLIYPAQSYRVEQSRSTNFDLGADYALLSWLRIYLNTSDVVTPPQVLFPDPAGNLPVPGHGTSQEIGFKFNNAARTISGSLSAYHSIGRNEEEEVSTTVENDINPNGLNGRGNVGQYIDLDRRAEGVQFVLTANPTPNWRLRFTAADVFGTILDTKTYGQLYNDQFYENASGQVTYADGSLVYVTPTYNAKAPVATATTAGAVPLTVAMMNNAASPYYANPTNPTGQISSTAAVATVLKTVDPVHGAILTGATGLPISSLQITPNFTPPGSLTIAQAGDRTGGYPQYSFNSTSVYTFSHDWLKGLAIGGTISQTWRTAEYYYYPNGVTTAAGSQVPRSLFSAPNLTRFDLILGYMRKFRHVTFSTQLNIDNLFNTYKVVVYPDEVTGWSVPSNLTAAFWGQPRSYVWTNTIGF
jgi:outer membrane receptor protein involved in Fe transport